MATSPQHLASTPAGASTHGQTQGGEPPALIRHAPIEALLGGTSEPALRWTPGSARFMGRVQRDAQLLLAAALIIPVLLMELAYGVSARGLGVVVPVAFLIIQVLLTGFRSPPRWLPTARLALSLGFVALADVWLEPTGNWPLGALAIPVVALAASTGGLAGWSIASAGMLLMLAPLALSLVDERFRPEILAATMAALIVAVGSRRVVAALERSAVRLRAANSRQRRTARQLVAVETVGRVLAREGPTHDALDRVMGVLEDTFGYRYPSVYTWDGRDLHLGAQRNYRYPIEVIPGDRGVLGRVVQGREAVFLVDARSDPDFLSADPDVVSEIAIPLESEGELLGILNVETSGDHRLDEDDFSTMKIVGDRVTAALALGRERQKLHERAELLDRLTQFATSLAASLDPSTMDDEVAEGARGVIPADIVTVIELEEASESYVVAGVSGGDARMVGAVIQVGEGVSGRAIKSRTVVVDDHLDRQQFPKSTARARVPDTIVALAAPMVFSDAVVGAVCWAREDLSRPFTPQEQEIAALLASRVGLALINARLHQRAQLAAITDPLTGLHNRRHFDAAMEREDHQRRRTPAERRRQRSAILFDLDHFGRVNKRHGHQIGDRVLRLFAATLRSRARVSDLVARYGGEEFVVVLDGASREMAATIAEEVRLAFAASSVEDSAGEDLVTTVSAGVSTLEPWEVEGSILLERADVALAMAKAAGRDQVVIA